MRTFIRSAFFAGLTCSVMFTAQPARAVVTVLGEGFAHECYEAAFAVTNGLAYVSPVLSDTLLSKSPVEICDMAISQGGMSLRDLAGTHVNRGVLRFIAADHAAALRDFDAAIRADDSVGESHANRGAALVALKRYADSIPSISKGIELVSEEIEKCYYNRAIAYEETGNVKGAYYDYLKAAELRPEWEAPRKQLTRFKVVSRAAK